MNDFNESYSGSYGQVYKVYINKDQIAIKNIKLIDNKFTIIFKQVIK